MDNLVAYSLVAVYSAMGVYTVAFILFTLDLAKRSAQRAEPVAARAQQAAVNSSSMTSVLERPVAPLQSGGATRYERAGLALSILGFVLHAAAVLTRGFAAERVPRARLRPRPSCI